MYKLLLIFKYLRRKLAPLFAAAAVTLCTAMVIIVISVMGGFLQMMEGAVKTLTGQVAVFADVVGFANYEELRADLEALPEVEAVTPLLRVPALLKVEDMFGIGGIIKPVEVLGIDPASYSRVTGYADTLHWKPADLLEEIKRDWDTLNEDQRREAEEILEVYSALLEAGKTLEPVEAFDNKPLIVLGIEIRPTNERDEAGQYQMSNWGVRGKATLTLLPISKTGNVGAYGAEVSEYLVANEFKSGLYEIDNNRVFVHMEALQKALKMEEVNAPKLDPETGEPTDEMIHEPGRIHELMILSPLQDDKDLAHLRRVVQETVLKFRDRQTEPLFLKVETWRERHGVLLDAVAMEKGLITFLFIFISFVAAVMIAATFYMIVLEKTRDIGVLRAIGASAMSIANVFLGYGLTIGILGAGLGVALAYYMVYHLNEFHDMLGHRLISFVACAIALAVLVLIVFSIALIRLKGREDRFETSVLYAFIAGLVVYVLFALTFDQIASIGMLAKFDAQTGIEIWNAKTYYFDKIPEDISVIEAAAIAVGAIVFSLLGALVPAILASRLNPVEALRYE